MSQSRTPIYSLLVANTLSFVAESIAMVAIPWFVLELTGSYAQMGIVGFFTVMPRVVATFLGGQLVDRLGFRTSSVMSDLLSAIAVCGIPILYLLDQLSFNWLIVLVVLGAFFDGPGATAKDAMVPELAASGRIELDRINAYFQGTRRLSLFIGPVVAGFLIVLVGTAHVLWVNAAVFGLSALITLILVPNVEIAKTSDDDGATYWSNALFGFRFLRQQPLLLWLASIVCLMNFLDAPLTTVQMPALVSENYGGAQQLGTLMGINGGGAVIGTIIFSLVSNRLSRRTTFIACFFVAGLVFLVLAIAPPYPIAIATMIVLGLVSGPLNPILMSIRQERVPAEFRARVFGTTTAISFVAIPFGQLIGGFMAEWLGVQLYIGLVAGIYIIVVMSFFVTPVLHEMDQGRALGRAGVNRKIAQPS